MLKKTLKPSIVIFLLYIIISYLVVQKYDFGDPEILALVLAGALAIVNLFLTVILIEKNLTKNKNEFIKGFLQSTMIRMLILLAIFFTIMVLLSLNHFVFGIGFFILYFLFQMIEIYILHTNKQTNK